MKTNKIDYNSTVNQDIKSKLVNREVIYCVSNLVYELAKKADEFPEYSDDLYGAFEGIPDYEEAALNVGWKQVINKKDSFTSFIKGNYDDNGKVIVEDKSNAETWEELCNEQDIDAYEFAPEIFEHWIVTDYLANKLEDRGEKVLRDFFGMTVWCRTTTGQAILLDHVISEICADMEILEGQKNDWSKR